MLARVAVLLVFLSARAVAQTLPSSDGPIEVPVQEWSHRPGPRSVVAHVHYPGGTLAHVGPRTGVMLTLHNWGGSKCVGTANPSVLAERYDVVAVCVDYLQSGPKDSIEGPEPYDFGWLQALDALKALHATIEGLRAAKRPFDVGRVYCTGGSGGGNVALMANKLAPRTFACVIDLCGMKKLSPDIAFNLPGGSDLNARWRREPDHKWFLSSDAQDIRYVGHPDHLAEMRRLGATSKVIVVHGVDDTTCPTADARQMVAAMEKASLDVEGVFVTRELVDGQVFKSTGHGMGDRTEIVERVAGKFLKLNGEQPLVREGKTDFDRRETIRYATRGGAWAVDYSQGFPSGRFEPTPPPPVDPKLFDPATLISDKGFGKVENRDAWQHRRRQILERFQLAAGRLPAETHRVPLSPQWTDVESIGKIAVRKVRFQSDAFEFVDAWLLVPPRKTDERLPVVLCLHQTQADGKDEPVGRAGSPDMRYALELAERGYITLSPDYPSFGESTYDFSRAEYASGTIKGVWDNLLAIDLLETLPEVDPARIGVIGHSLGGHNAIFTALFDERLKAIVSNCGFCTLAKDDVPSWTGPRYMPRIADQFQNERERLPFDFPELIAALAPRPFFAGAAQGDDDFRVDGVIDCIDAARPIYKLLGVEDRLEFFDYPGPHGFPGPARQKAYAFLDAALK